MSVYAGKKEIRDLLLSHGAELDLPTAAAVGNLDRVKQIVEKNPASAASFSADGFPVVALSAVSGHLDVARYLAEHGGDINAPATNGSGYNALTGAVAGGHTQMVEWLLKNGANANYRYGPGYSPLLTAAANGHVEIIKLLLAHGADLHATTNDGKSALASGGRARSFVCWHNFFETQTLDSFPKRITPTESIYKKRSEKFLLAVT